MSNIDPTTGLPFPNLYTTTDSPAVVPTDTNGYIDLGITVDPLQLISDAFGFIQAQLPGWKPAEGNLETWLIEACANMVATDAVVAANVPLAIFEWYGANLVGLPPLAGTAATVTTTWTMVDTAGYTVPQGTVYSLPLAAGGTALFQTTAPFTVPAGQSSTTPGAVTMTAVAVGTTANGIAAGTMAPVSALPYVSQVVSTATTSGGAAAETTNAYINRLASQLQLLSPRPILPGDFATLATQVDGVARALAVNNLNPYANQLTAVDAEPTTGLGTWTAGANCTVASGANGLSLTATAVGTMTAVSGLYPVSSSVSYTALASATAAATPESCTVGFVFYDQAGNDLSTYTGTAATDSTSAATALTAADTTPSSATQVRVQVSAVAAAVGEVHDFTKLGLFLGSANGGTWTAGGLMTGQERMVTVVPVDANGDALGATIEAAVATYLEGLREVNFVVNVVPPTYYGISVNANVVCNYGADTTSVQSSVVSALTSLLSAANWAAGNATPPVWLNDTTVRYLEVAAAIGGVAGVHHIASLTVNGGTADVTMPGFAPLPSPSISVAVSSASAGT